MEEVISNIKRKWNLPTDYLSYLAKYPKKGKFIDDERFANGLSLYGASELIKRQEGYSYNPVKKKPIDVWPKEYVVIADDGADPYVLDLSKSDGKDAPVLFAYHGEGEWDFQEYAQSFTEFLRDLDID
jgi:hypothetical protein